MVNEGRKIIDIGPAFTRRVSELAEGKDPYRIAYNIERMNTKGYGNIEKVFQRFGKWIGGVPGLDW